MAWVTMETEVLCDLRFIFLTLGLPRPFCWFKKFELARNRNMLSLLVIHTMNRNSHKYLIYLLISHIIQYSSGYDLRFPRKWSWFESQLGNNIYFLLLLFSVCVCCFYFDIFSFLSLTVSTIRQLLHLGIKSQNAVDICIVYRNSVFSCVHTHHACITAIFDSTNEVFM